MLNVNQWKKNNEITYNGYNISQLTNVDKMFDQLYDLIPMSILLAYLSW